MKNLYYILNLLMTGVWYKTIEQLINDINNPSNSAN